MKFEFNWPSGFSGEDVFKKDKSWFSETRVRTQGENDIHISATSSLFLRLGHKQLNTLKLGPILKPLHTWRATTNEQGHVISNNVAF